MDTNQIIAISFKLKHTICQYICVDASAQTRSKKIGIKTLYITIAELFSLISSFDSSQMSRNCQIDHLRTTGRLSVKVMDLQDY